MIRYLNNERGSSVIPFTALFAMAMVILMVLLMMWISAEITFMNIRISEDTYNAMREGNLHAYYQKLSTDSSYRNELQQMICDNIRTAMPLETASYKIDDMTLTFLENDDSIEYVLSCSVEYYISLFGDARTIRTEEILLNGRHNLKLY